MAKKVYIAGRANKTNNWLKLKKEIENLGFSVVSGWLELAAPKKPYRGNKNLENQKFVEQLIKQAASADVFILFSEPGMRGAYVEMGAFLYSTYLGDTPKPRLIIVGGESETHIFESAEFAEFVRDEEELLKVLISGQI